MLSIDHPMDAQTKLEDLKSVAAKLAVEILVRNLADDEISIKSGYCKLNGKDMIVLDKRLTPAEQVEVLLRELRRFNLEDIYIPGWIRERLDGPDRYPD